MSFSGACTCMRAGQAPLLPLAGAAHQDVVAAAEGVLVDGAGHQVNLRVVAGGLRGRAERVGMSGRARRAACKRGAKPLPRAWRRRRRRWRRVERSGHTADGCTHLAGGGAVVVPHGQILCLGGHLVQHAGLGALQGEGEAQAGGRRRRRGQPGLNPRAGGGCGRPSPSRDRSPAAAGPPGPCRRGTGARSRRCARSPHHVLPRAADPNVPAAAGWQGVPAASTAQGRGGCSGAPRPRAPLLTLPRSCRAGAGP